MLVIVIILIILLLIATCYIFNLKKINNNTVSLIKESNFITRKSILLKLMKYMLPQLDLLVIIRI